MLGMALSGPDTGMSQWFINLSPQPHLDGTYTVFGRLVGNMAALQRITQGDVIRTIARQ
jgi:cyclophilin family peptidyl-prolyl cis-trans isomerase